MIRNSMDANYGYKTVTRQQSRPGEINFGSQPCARFYLADRISKTKT